MSMKVVSVSILIFSTGFIWTATLSGMDPPLSAIVAPISGVAPSVVNMARPPPGREGHQVQADRCGAEVGPPRGNRAGGAQQSVTLLRGHRVQGRVETGPALDLDHHHQIA